MFKAGRSWSLLFRRSAERWISRKNPFRLRRLKVYWSCKTAGACCLPACRRFRMRFHIVTIFPEFFGSPFQHGVVARAQRAGRLDIQIHDLRNWTYDRHRTVDDRPFGGGEGMLLKPEPLFEAVESILPERTNRRRIVLLSAQGRLFDQPMAVEFSALDELLLICGRYEGVDERVAEHLADAEVSIGDYVLSGGELGAAVIVDAVA